MTFANIFDSKVIDQMISRLDKLNANTKPLWGTMDAAKMLAHCNVTYEMVFTQMHPKPNFLMAFILKAFVKKVVVGDAPYAKNSRTAPQFIMHSDKDFEVEKTRLINYMKQVEKLGADYFDQKPSLSFGVLTKNEWNTMFYKHLDHHLAQFGV
jgi:hypothetical protein